MPYCPRCGTPLSAQEVAQGYKDVKERSAIVRFKVKNEDAYILALTTTPWTLPSNLALCVHPTETYLKVKACLLYTSYSPQAKKKIIKIKAEEESEICYEIQADYQQIKESNILWLRTEIREETAVPAVPIILLGGNRWMISEFYQGKTLEDDCGVDEETWFIAPPSGFTEQWNPGNDLQLSLIHIFKSLKKTDK